MSLNSDHLDAFVAVANRKSFSKAAKDLAISQPALSQRIIKLEESLGLTLFIRGAAWIDLTDPAKKLLQHCKLRRDLEKSLLEELHLSNDRNSLSGVIRIAGFSSVMRSVIIPAFTELLVENPKLQIESLNLELRELPAVLKRGQADFVITDKPIELGQVESIHLGNEDNVLIEATRAKLHRPNLYFDHDSDDQTTYNFFKKQRKVSSKGIQRSFLDEIYSIIDAVERGLGRAVVSRHLIENNSKVRVVQAYASMKSPVYLNYLVQPIYLPLHEKVKDAIIQGCSKIFMGTDS